MAAETAVAVIVFVVSAFVTYVMSQQKGPTPILPLQELPGSKINSHSTQEPVPVVYGTRRVSGNDVDMHTTEDGDLWIVQTLSEGPCSGIHQTGGVDQAFLGEKLANEFGSYADYYFYSGTSGQTVDSDYQAVKQEWTDCLHYTTYIIWKLTYDPDYFQSPPTREVVLDGRLLYDLRDATTAFSDNPVLCLYDYLTNNRYGMGISATKIDEPSWAAAANYCDTAGWTLNMKLDSLEAGIDVVNTILAHFRGVLVWYGGKYYLRYCDLNEESSVMTLDDENICQDQDSVAQISINEPSRFTTSKGLRVKFVDPDKDYIEDDLPIGEEVGNIKQLDLPGCTDRQMAIYLGQYYLRRWQLNRGVTGVFRGDAIKLEPNDLVTLSSTALGLSNQLMRVKEANIRTDLLVELTFEYESIYLYEDNYNTTIDNIYQCTLFDPAEEPPSVANVLVTEQQYDYRLRTFTRLLVAFDKPANYPWFKHVEVWFSLDDISWEHLFSVTDDFEIANVEEGRTYYLRLKVVSIHDRKQADRNDYKTSSKIIGYITNPESLTYLDAVVNSNTINLYSTAVADPDVEHYEFRLGSAWTGGILLGAYRKPNLSLYGVKPGTHTFLVNTLGNNGNYGDNPQSKTVDLIAPPDGWTEMLSGNINTPSGSHVNTEWTNYDGEAYLQCSHVGGAFSGVFSSDVIDLGSSERYLVYADTEVVTLGAGNTWDDVASGVTPWDDMAPVGKPWSKVWQLVEGPNVAISLLYGENTPPDIEVGKLEILSTIVTGRYYQLKVAINDPSSSINALVRNLDLRFCQRS